MPTITLEKHDLLQMIDEKLSDSDLEDVINKIKPEVEEVSTEEVTYELNPDRPDLFSSPGLARAINGFLGLETGFPTYKLNEAELTVRVEKVEVRPYIACGIVRNVQLDETIVESLMQFQEVLHHTLGRGRRKVAIGLHNLEKIEPPIQYISSSPEREMFPLQASKKMQLQEILINHQKGKKYAHLLEDEKNFPTIIDQKGIFSFPPVINSKRTKLTRNVNDIFIDVTGINLKAINDTMNVLITSLAERGGEIQKVKLKYPNQEMSFPSLEGVKKTLDVERINKLIGVNFTPRKIAKLLKKMRYDVEINDESEVKILVPPYRSDILHPVDIIEDICIGYDFDEFIPKPAETASMGGLHPIETFSREVRNIMIGLGFQEVMNPTLMNKETLKEKMCLGKESIKAAELSNPVSEEYDTLRNQLLPSLLSFLSQNTHRSFPQKIFELEDVVVLNVNAETKTRNIKKLSATISDHKVGYSDIRANLDALLQQFDLKYHIEPTKHPSFILGRVGKITVKGGGEKKKLGFLGEIHPQVLLKFKIEKPTVGLELNLENMFHCSFS